MPNRNIYAFILSLVKIITDLAGWVWLDDKQLEPYGLKQFEIRSSEVADKAYTPIGEDWYINLNEKLIVAPCEDEQTRCVFKIIMSRNKKRH